MPGKFGFLQNQRKGDLAVYNPHSDWEVLHIGSTGQVLYVSSGLPIWHTLVAADIPNIALAAWTGFTPTITAGAGAFTTVSAAGRWFQVSKILFFSLTITITANGTAANDVRFTLPNSLTGAANQYVFGREEGLTGSALTANITSGGNIAIVRTYNNGYPGGTGAVITVSGSVEVT